MSSSGTQSLESYWAATDLNGNVIGLCDTGRAISGTGSTAGKYAVYEYDPFGQAIRVSEPEEDLNPFRFSTKYQDIETGLYFYGFRYYNPITGRWPNRDPIGEGGGLNLYGFVNNNAVTQFDTDGRQIYPVSPQPPIFPQPGPENGVIAGAEVKPAINKTLADVEKTFKEKWSDAQRCASCSRLINIFNPTDLMDAWDLNGVRYGLNGAYVGTGVTNNGANAKSTVTFGGNVYFGASVAYTLFGKAMSLCSKFYSEGNQQGGGTYAKAYEERMALMMVRGHKVLQWYSTLKGQTYEIPLVDGVGALAFTRYGYKGTPPGLLTSGGQYRYTRLVQASNKVHPDVILDWTWKPYH
jgi:RHS repeat-associated protein